MIGMSESAQREYNKIVNRRSFLRGASIAGVGVAAGGLIACGSSKAQSGSTADTAAQIFTAALIAEDLGTTMYYNALIGGVIQDPNLAGPGGSATNVTSSGSVANVGYLRGALAEEISHANLLRSLITTNTDASADPYTTFYFPTGTFDNLTNFFPILLALETAFIAAYMTAVQEFALMLGNVAPYTSSQNNPLGGTYTSADLAAYAKVSAAILGVEAEHRTLARAIPPPPSFNGVNILPSDDVCFESTDGLTEVYNGMTSAAAALAPFLTSGSGTTAYQLAPALSGAAAVQLACTGMPPM
jgi:hypothetical protein